jgi:hypothetical protein
VSPTSRGRRPKKKPAGPRGSRRRDEDAPFAAILREVGKELADADDALDAELTVSALAGSWWDIDLVDADPEVEFGERLVAYAARRRDSRPALALLRVVAELGTPAQREAASRGADALAAAGVPDPAWAGDLRTVRHTGSWAYGDVFGDQTTVLLVFDRPGRPHGTMVLVDHTLGGIAKDAFVVDDPDATLGDIRASADDLMWVRELAAAEAAALLVPAFAATDAGRDLPLDEDLRDTRALVVARLRLLPEPLTVLPRRAEEPEPLAEEFLASDARPREADADAVAACARLIAQLMADIDGQPGRVSPAKLELLLDELIPDVVDEDDPEWEVLPTVLPAWVEWAAERAGLSSSAREALAEDVDALLDDEGADIPEELVEALLDDVPEDVTPEDVAEILARRTFAVGGPLLVDDDGELALDPADPDQRSLAIRGEHPEYAAALDNPFGDDLVDGVNPRLHIAMHEMVANQLWDGEPAEVWPAALRLFASGMDRHDVLHALADVAARHVWRAVQEQRPYDAAAYAADLDALAPEIARRN